MCWSGDHNSNHPQLPARERQPDAHRTSHGSKRQRQAEQPMSAVMTDRTDATQPEEREREPLSLRVLRASGQALAPEDGWLTIVLLTAVVYITVLSIQSANPPWVPGKMSILTTLAFA